MCTGSRVTYLRMLVNPFLGVLNEQASKENYIKAGKDKIVSKAKIPSYRVG